MNPPLSIRPPDTRPESARIRRNFLRRKRHWADSEDVEVEMTPLIDCVFLLLIFFLVTTMLKKLEKQIPVVLPDSTVTLAPVARTETVILGVDVKGNFYREAGRDAEGNIEYAPLEDLSAYLRQVASERGTQTPIRLDADRNTPFQKVIDALDICSIQGFENVGVRIQHTGKEYYELGDRRSVRRSGSEP
jgi:biopolymer transport protein ExbD